MDIINIMCVCFFKILGMDVLEVFLGELFIIEDVMDKIEYIGLGVIEGGLCFR